MNYVTTTDEMVRRIGSIPDDLSAGACFGTPVERDGHMLIPVARINFGYGMAERAIRSYYDPNALAAERFPYPRGI